MPTISMFYGILILIYFYDNKQHNTPHIHAEFAEYEASVAIDDGRVLAGSLPSSKLKLVQAWIEIHREDLMVDWKLAVAGEPVFKIDPLRQAFAMNETNKVSMEKIVKAIPLADFKIEVLTSSGLAGIFDMKPYLKGSAFKQLLNENYFNQVKPLHLGIAWPDEQDISSDTVIADIKNNFAGSHLS